MPTRDAASPPRPARSVRPGAGSDGIERADRSGGVGDHLHLEHACILRLTNNLVKKPPICWRDGYVAATATRAGHPADRPGSGHVGPRGIRSDRGIAQSAAGRRHAPAHQGRRPFQAVAGHRRRACRYRAAESAAWHHPRRAQPRGHKPVHQPSGQAHLEAAEAESPLRAARPAQSALADVELAAVRPFGQCGGVRGRGRAGKPTTGAGAGAAGGPGWPVPGRDRRALPR